MKNITKEVAVYKTEYGSEIIWGFKDPSADWVRISKPTSVVFEHLPVEEQLSAEVRIINKKIEGIKEEALLKINKLETKRQELLALTEEK